MEKASSNLEKTLRRGAKAGCRAEALSGGAHGSEQSLLERHRPHSALSSFRFQYG